jgi:hypothetical protein
MKHDIQRNLVEKMVVFGTRRLTAKGTEEEE